MRGVTRAGNALNYGGHLQTQQSIFKHNRTLMLKDPKETAFQNWCGASEHHSSERML